VIHAFVAGFAGCIGVLVALWCWNRTSEWQANRRIERVTRHREPMPEWTAVAIIAALAFVVILVAVARAG